jgi:hypothetical protein
MTPTKYGGMTEEQLRELLAIYEGKTVHGGRAVEAAFRLARTLPALLSHIAELRAENERMKNDRRILGGITDSLMQERDDLYAELGKDTPHADA